MSSRSIKGGKIFKKDKKKIKRNIEKSTLPKSRLTADSLQWKPVKTSSFSGVDNGGGMMMLEELDDVGIEYEEDTAGRKVAHFVASESKGKGKEKAAALTVDETDEVEGLADSGVDHSKEETGDGLPSFADVAAEDMNEADDQLPIEDEVPFNDKLLPEWSSIPLHSTLKRSLLALGFVNPTDIQRRSLPQSLKGRDVVGVAETGSGKTLAYSLPILSHLLRSPPPSRSSRRALSALILCPTRELALQVVDHLDRILKHALATEDDEGQPKKKAGPPRISVGSVVGGLSAQKQKRIVERGADILVATPGRLWDLIRTDEELAAGIRGLKFLVIDEADRMIENGHFAELENIVRLTQRHVGQRKGPDDDDPVFTSAANVLAENEAREDMQTFVFSATLSKDLQQNLKKRHRAGPKKGSVKTASALEDLVNRLDFRDENPEVIDLSPEGGVVAHLKESMVECVVAEKDLYLYYFLLRYPGRTLVFVGSIDGIRRLIPLFELLQVPVYPLHSQLQQKQRLKNLDRFKSSKSGVLIATDVAARGLDIPQVDHVVHFNLPRTADAYIHRSGRTARAQNPGFALQLCAPEEKGMQRALMKSLGRSHDLPDLTIESGFLPKLKERLQLAREIEKAQHGVKKENHDRNWLKETAEAMDLDIDPDMLSESDEDADAPVHGGKKRKRLSLPSSTKLSNLKGELKEKLNEPLVARGISARYPTGGSRVIVDDLVRSTGHQTLLGAATNKAWDEVMDVRKRPMGTSTKRKKRVAK